MLRAPFYAILVSVGCVTSANATTLKTYSDPQLGFEIAMPQACRHATGPGTIEAVCTPDLDAVKARSLAAARGWLFEIDYEVAPSDAQPYSVEAFKAEAPTMICGETDASGVALSNVLEATERGRLTVSADVACPALTFLNLPARTATVRVIIAGTKRFRLIARTPATDATAASPLAQAFLASFKLTGE